MTEQRKAPRAGTATRLLRDLLAQPGFDAALVAQELVVSVGRLAAFVTGEREIPLERQMCLALLVIERCPALARRGHALRGQVGAAMAMERGDSAVHSSRGPAFRAAAAPRRVPGADTDFR